MEAVANTKIDFAALSSLLRVISTSPPWDETSLGIQRLTSLGLDGKPYDARPRDEQNVRGFARLLRQDSELIYRAILCGAYAGRLLVGASQAERVLRGLQAIRTVYRFDKTDEAGVNASLSVFLDDVAKYYGQPDGIPSAGRPLTAVSDAGAWVASLRKDLRTIHTTSPMGVPFSVGGDGGAMLSIKDVQSVAWQSAIARIDAKFTGRGTELRAGITEIMCDAVRIPPATVVPLQLDSMGIVEWSDAFLHAVYGTPREDPDHVPLTIAPIALRALGFGVIPASISRLRKAASTNSKEEVDAATRFIVERPWVAATADGPSAFIIRRGAGSLITTWQASQQAPALAVTYDQLADLIANDLVSPATFPGFPYPSLVAVEDQPDVTVGREAAKKTLLASSGNQTLREAWFYPSAPKQPPNVPFVVEPRSADDLVARGLAPSTGNLS